MHFNSFIIFLLIFFFIVSCDYNSFYSPIHKRLGQVVGTDCTSTFRCIEMLVEDQDFHTAKKKGNAVKPKNEFAFKIPIGIFVSCATLTKPLTSSYTRRVAFSTPMATKPLRLGISLRPLAIPKGRCIVISKAKGSWKSRL